MKQQITLFMFLLLIGCGQKNTEGNTDYNSENSSTMEDFGGRVFELVKKDDYKSIAGLMLDLSEYQELIRLSSLEDSEKKIKSEQLESNLKSDIETLKQSYDRFKDKIESSGIDWGKTNLDFIDFKHERENKIEKADLYLNFKYKGVNYKIELKNCYKLKSSWKMGNEIRFNQQMVRYNPYGY